MSIAGAVIWLLVLASVGGAPWVAVALACFTGYMIGKRTVAHDD